jgi:endogenous inhibitor of DNA gyrase (YacG/DUF329 family)
MTVKCPICKREVDLTNPDFPFCGERCRIIDLGNWASEKYVVSSPIEPGTRSEEEENE